MESGELATRICQQIADVFTVPIVSPSALSILVDEIKTVSSRSGKVFLFSVGREGLMLKAFCMRLYHLGLQAHCVFDMNTPPCSDNDLLIASAGPGGHATINVICEKAKSSGARVVLLTAQPQTGSATPFASIVAHIPAQTMADDRERLADPQLLPMGSVYEGSLFVLFEMVVYKLVKLLGQSPEQIRARHTNLE